MRRYVCLGRSRRRGTATNRAYSYPLVVIFTTVWRSREVREISLLSSLIGRINGGRLASIVHPPGVGLEFSQNLCNTHPVRVTVFSTAFRSFQSRLLGAAMLQGLKQVARTTAFVVRGFSEKDRWALAQRRNALRLPPNDRPSTEKNRAPQNRRSALLARFSAP